MNLFKRILLSLFPEDITHQSINPASMFVSLVSAKQFFSVINRKIVENYKLNLFDIGLDSFEVKIGFGENPTIKVKDVETYYAYCAVANMNGYRLFNPSNMANSLTLVMSHATHQIFKDYHHSYFLNFLFCIYLLTFVFTSRIKVFPFTTKEENTARFIEVFFEFYKLIFEQTGKKIADHTFQTIKKELLKHIELFFCLFYFYQHCQNIFKPEEVSEKELYMWMFHEEIKKGNYKHMVEDYINNFSEYSRSSTFSTTEKNIINLILPADILIRYLFEGKDIFAISNIVIGEIYDKEILQNFLRSFLKNSDQLEGFLEYITNYNHFKTNYFRGIQKLVANKFKPHPHTNDIEEELEEFMSSIGHFSHIENIQIPERIRKESQLMEKLMNFYMTFIGGFWIARGDSFGLRIFKSEFLQTLIQRNDLVTAKPETLHYYGSLLYHYSKNIFYYKNAFEHIRAGKEKFNLPFKSTFKEVYSNIFLLKLFDENFLTTLFQDINIKDIKIFVKHKELLELFKSLHGKTISQRVKKTPKPFLETCYKSTTTCIKKGDFLLKTIHQHFHNQDIIRIKESLYTLDFWIQQDFLNKLQEHNISFTEVYSDYSIF